MRPQLAPSALLPRAPTAYDNFRVSNGTFGCPSWWSDSNADWQSLPVNAK